MKVSIITVTYHSEKTLQDCMDSVWRQTYPDIEYILVDGLSADRTTDVIRSNEHKFGGRLRWISEKDKGLYDAMNKGIGMATGDVVGILNSDDFFTTDDVIETVVRSFEDKDVDAVYGDVRFVKPADPEKCVRYYSSAFFRPFLFRFGLQPAHPSFYCKKKWFDRLGGYRLDLKIAADFELLTRFLYKHRLKTAYIKKNFVTMRTGGLSTRSLRNRHILNIEDVKACRANGIFTLYPLICLKYFIKLIELARA